MSLKGRAPHMMPFQQLAVFLRDNVAVLGGELSIKLCTLATKVGTDAEPINALAQDAALLSSIYRKVAEVMLRGSAINTTIFSHKALDEIENAARACLFTLINLTGSIKEASERTRGPSKSSADGTKLAEDQQNVNGLTQIQSSAVRTEFAETRYLMLLICHVGDLASDVKTSLSFSVINYHLKGVGSDLLQGPKRQTLFDSILALHAFKISTSEPPSSPGQSITGPSVAQLSSPAVSLDEDFEMIDTPSTRPGSPVILERSVVEPTFSCALPDRSLPISIKSITNKRRLSIDASDEPDSDTKSRRTSEGGASNTIDQIDSHSEGLSKATDDDESIHAPQNDQNEEWTLLEKQENNRPSETELFKDKVNCTQGTEIIQPVLSKQQDKQHILANVQEQNQSQPSNGDDAPVCQDKCVSSEQMKIKDQQKPPVYPDISEEHLQVYQKNPMFAWSRQQVTSQPRGGNHALQDYQMQLMLLEQQNKKRLLMARQEQNATRTPPPPPPVTGGNNALQHYQMQVMLQEQENKKRLLMPMQEQNAPNAAPPPRGNPALQNHQMQMMLQKQQTMGGHLMAGQEQDAPCIPPPPSTAGNYALQDRQTRLQIYQAQLMQLEQENVKRRSMARQERETAGMPPTPGENRALEAAQTKLMLLEQTVKRNLSMAKQEQDCMQSSVGSAAYTCQSSNLGTQKIPVKQPDKPSIPHASPTPDMLEQARLVLLKHYIRFSALSDDQRNSFAAQTLNIQDNLARTWAQESRLLYKTVEQELIKHDIDPEHLTAAQLVAFAAKRPDMQTEAIRIYVRIQKRNNQVHAQNDLRDQGKEPRALNLAASQGNNIQVCGQGLDWNPNQQQLPKQDVDDSKGVEHGLPVSNEVGIKKNENTQRLQSPSSAPITYVGRRSHGQTIDSRIMEILRRHSLKSETLTTDQVNLLQIATGEQLERFVQAWVETSHGVQSSNAAPSAHHGLQEQKTRHSCISYPSEQQRMMEWFSSPQPLIRQHTKEAQIPNMGAPGVEIPAHPSDTAISAYCSPQEQQTSHGGSCWLSEQQRMLRNMPSPQRVAQGHAERAQTPDKGTPGFPISTQERMSKLFRPSGNGFLGFHPEEHQKHDEMQRQPQIIGEIQPGHFAGMKRTQDIQKLQQKAQMDALNHGADEARRQRELRLDATIAERAKETLKVDQAKWAEKEKQAEQRKTQQRLAGEHGEQAQKIEVEQQIARDSMKKAYLETLRLNKEHSDAQLAEQPRPEMPAASFTTPMHRQRMLQQTYYKRMLAEQAWKKFEAGKTMPEKTAEESKKADDNDAIKKSEEEKKMPVKTPQPTKAIVNDEVKDHEKAQKQPLDEAQKDGLKIVEGLLREYTTLYD